MAKKPDCSSEKSRWEAIRTRNKRAENDFCYAVRSTGVYCRPACSSRLPKRENVEFFGSAREAEIAGYRPCRRCNPNIDSPRKKLTDAIVWACRRMEQVESGMTLVQLAEEAGLSLSRFHRVFKSVVGVTPKKYMLTQKKKRFRESLAVSRSVTEAIYDAGYSSSSRAYEYSIGHLAMAPSAYKKGAKGEKIRFGIARCSLGWVIIGATKRGICSVEFGDDPQALTAQLRQRFPKADIDKAGPDFSATVRNVVGCIERPEKDLYLPLDIRGTAFQEQVWNALREIPAGTTVSYTELAGRIGKAKAVRAVAQACAANRLAVVVPCHRAVRSDGSLSGYRWGVWRKQAILEKETDSDD